jgi:hypothetical protein
MLVCTNCGYHNPDGTEFCGNCEIFLEWNSVHVEARQPEEPEVVDDEPEPKKGFLRRVKSALQRDPDDHQATDDPDDADAG